MAGPSSLLAPVRPQAPLSLRYALSTTTLPSGLLTGSRWDSLGGPPLPLRASPWTSRGQTGTRVRASLVFCIDNASVCKPAARQHRQLCAIRPVPLLFKATGFPSPPSPHLSLPCRYPPGPAQRPSWSSILSSRSFPISSPVYHPRQSLARSPPIRSPLVDHIRHSLTHPAVRPTIASRADGFSCLICSRSLRCSPPSATPTRSPPARTNFASRLSCSE